MKNKILNLPEQRKLFEADYVDNKKKSAVKRHVSSVYFQNNHTRGYVGKPDQISNV